MSTQTIPPADYSRAAFEQAERRRFLAELEQVEKAPLSDRKDGRTAYTEALQTPELVAERIGWLLNGSYGQGSYCAALQVIGNPRQNVQAWLGQTIAAIEWHCPANFARAAWCALSDAQKAALAKLIQVEIDYKIAKMEGEDA